MKVRIDMTGLRYGRLVGIDFAHAGPSGHAHWRFACDCGAEVIADGGNVRAGSTQSCGCLHRERSAARLTEHGHRAARRHGPTYRAWQAANRHGPGMMCERWRADFVAFLADLGERPPDTVLARTDPERPFAPGNCRWAPVETRAERAKRGWQARRAAAAQPGVARASTSQSRSWPAAAAIILPSTAR